MTNYVRILDSVTYGELAKIENVINPLISEQINDVYNFEFETVFDEVSKFARGGNIIEIEDDYFRIATTSKYLNGNYRVFAEHVSFALSKAYFEDYVGEGVDGTAEEILTPMLNQVGWGIGSIASTDVKFYKPSTGASVRKQIIDVANLFGLEIIWNKFSVSLVNLRGSMDPIPFTLGENLIGVSETIDLTGEDPEVSYEVDVLDLSQLDGFEGFAKINLGDVVNVLAPNVDLNIISRIVYRQYNPFSKVNVNLQIGRVIRDFTTYIRDEKEEDEEEAAKEIWLESFTVDGNEILSLDGVDATDGSAGALLDVNEIPSTIVITLKPKYQEYFVGVNIEQNSKHTKLILEDEFTNGSITIHAPFTKSFLNGAVKIGVSDKPHNTPRAETRSYFVDLKLTNVIENHLLDYFEIDNEDVLSLPGIDTAEGATHPIYDQVQRVKMKLIPDITYDYVSVVFFDGPMQTDTYDQSNFKDGILLVNTRFHSYSNGLKIVATLNSGEMTAIYTVSCVNEKDLPDPYDTWLSEFRIGDEDCLYLPGIIIDSANENLITAELPYKKDDEYTGLFIQLLDYYKDATVTITDETGKNISRGSSTVLPKGSKKLLITLSLGEERQYYGLEFVKDESDDSDSDNGYVLEFATAPLAPVVIFYFDKSYDEIESITTGIIGANMYRIVSAEKLTDGSKYTGIKVTTTGATTGGLVSVQAVCFNEVEK